MNFIGRIPHAGMCHALRVALIAASCAFAHAPAAAQEAAPQPPVPQVENTAPAGPVRRIVVQGTQRVEPETVEAYMQLSAGDMYTPAVGDNALKILFATGLFDDVRMNWDGETLTVRVVENPIVNQVAFEGNSDITTNDLEMEVQIEPRTVFTRAKVTADVQRIVELYRRQGHFGATVEPKIIQRPQNRVDLVFEINEGATTGIARINFVGNEVFSDSDLAGEILTTESAWWKFLATNDNYDPDRLTFDREQLRRFYLRNGYADFRVISAVAELAPDRSDFYVTFTVEEGRQYNFGKIEVDSQIRDLDPADLLPLLTTLEGSTYSSEQVDASVEALTFAAGTQGFVFTDIRPRIRRDPAAGVIDVVFRIEQGPRVYIERINIVGNTRTMDKVIRREIRLAEGDAFNRVLVDRSRTRIRGLGFFRDVAITQEPGSQPDRTVVTVNVTEQPTGQISLGAGYSSQDSFLAEFSYSETNLFGRGQFLRAGVSFSSFQKNFDLRFTEPYFLDRPLSAGVQLYRVETDYVQEAGYISTVSAFGLLAGFPLSEYSRVLPRYSISISQIQAATNASQYVKDAQGATLNSLVGYSYVYDVRNDTIRPTNGYSVSFSQDIAGLGGQVNYIRSEVVADYYRPVPILEGLVGRIRLSSGYIMGWGGQDVRLTDRFFKGSDTFRGFQIAGMGPRDIATAPTTALGGQFYAISTFELRLPDFLPEEYGIQFSLFSDIGTLGVVKGLSATNCLPIDSDNDPSTASVVTSCVRDDMSIRLSAGISVNWRSPFGPVQIDFGYPWIKQKYDRIQAIRFSAGTQL